MALRMWRTALIRSNYALLLYGKRSIQACYMNVPVPPVTKRTYCIEKINSIDSDEFDDHTVNAEERTTKLLTVLESKGITRYSRHNTLKLYQLLVDLGIKPQIIESQLEEMPDLLSHSIHKWQDTSSIFVEEGMDSLKILQSIALCPDLLNVRPHELRQNIAQLRKIKVGKLRIFTLVTKYPLLLFHSSKIKQRIQMIGSMFPPTELKTLIRNNPCILIDKWDTIMDKVMYIHKVMGLDQPHIASSKALRKSLLHIKTRHQFLYRAGLYKTPNLDKDSRSYKHNPRLTDIIDSSDKYFANKVARLTEQEFQVFCCMMADEKEGSHYSDSEDEMEDLKSNYYKKFERKI